MTITYFHDDNSTHEDTYHKVGVHLVNVDEKIRLQVERLVKAAVADAQLSESILWRQDALFHSMQHQGKSLKEHKKDIAALRNVYKGVDFASFTKAEEERFLRSGDTLVADVDAKPMSSFVEPDVGGKDLDGSLHTYSEARERMGIYDNNERYEEALESVPEGMSKWFDKKESKSDDV